MEYLLYEIKNNINGKIYVGVHKTLVDDDGYMGSGKYIKRAIEKHGIENFTKTILERFDSAEAMFAREKEIVTDEFLARPDVYNLRRGGHGGWELLLKTGANKVGRKNADIALEKMYGKDFRMVLGELAGIAAQTPEVKAIRKKTRQLKGVKSNSQFMNTVEVNEKRKKTFDAIEHQKGSKNSQYGSFWITNGVENKKTKNETIPDGWNRGRINFKKVNDEIFPLE
jgi:hypothetical protein